MADEKCVRDPRHDCFGLEAAARLEGRINALEDWQQDSKAPLGGHRGQVRVGGAGGCDCLCPGSYRIIRKRRPRRSAASP